MDRPGRARETGGETVAGYTPKPRFGVTIVTMGTDGADRAQFGCQKQPDRSAVESRAMRVTFAWRPTYPGSTSKEFVVVGSPGFGRPEFCCERMGEAWKAQAIQFGGWNGTLTTKECRVSFWFWHCYPEGACPDRLPIDFCPFCAEPIELVLLPLEKPAAGPDTLPQGSKDR